LSDVLAAVEFDDEHCFDASEVGNVGANGVLAAKPEAFDLLALRMSVPLAPTPALPRKQGRESNGWASVQ
jgi:hypothetical protein